MKAIYNSEYRNYFFGGLLLIFVAAYFGIGSHHPDEYFQIFEFANYKISNSNEISLPWEFTERMRPAFQPGITFVFIKICSWIGLTNPFAIAVLLRLLIGFFTWHITSLFILKLLKKDRKDFNIFILVLSQFLWFLPYLYSRFSSEIFAALFLLYAVYLLLYKTISKPVINNLLIGFLLALSFYARFQMAFALIGIAVYLIFVKKDTFKSLVSIAFGFIAGLSINLIIDFWFYKEWVFSPWEYFRANLLEGKAAGFGVSPFYQYAVDLFIYTIPLFSIILIPLMILGIWKNKLSIFTLIFIPFFIGHSLVGHKEIRFLFPMVFPMLILVIMGISHFWESPFFNQRKTGILLFSKIFLVLNLLLLFVRCILPAQESFSYFKTMYALSEDKPTLFIGYQRNPYQYASLSVHYIRNTHSETLVAKDLEDLRLKCDSLVDSKKEIYILSTNKDDPFRSWSDLTSYYTILPNWMHAFNFNDWISRSRIWVLYKLEKNKAISN